MIPGNLRPDQWEALEDLFDGLIESERPEEYISAVSDPVLCQALGELWREHARAVESGFLNTAVVSLQALAEPDFCFSAGQVLDDRFTVEKLLGSGGMGEVYLAFDRRLDVRVALKTISRDLAQQPEIRRRFVAEVQNARQVTHPNVCRIYDLSDDGKTPFYTMQYLEGPTLAEWLRGPAQPVGIRRKIALDIAEGLAAAHRSGIVHRDLKPANVIVTGTAANSSAAITDFGLARAFQENETSQSYSLQAGTLDYMAPELRQGSSATFASDIYAFGRILVQLVPGDRFAAFCMAPRPEQRPASLDTAIARWRSRPTRRRLLALAIAASPLAGYAAYKTFAPPRVVFGSRQRLLLNAFIPQADVVASAIRELIVSGLRQSPLVNIVADERFRSLFGGGRTAPGQSPSHDRLLSLARRAGVAFLLNGTLHRSGNTIKLLLDMIDTASGEAVLSIAESGTDGGLVRVADQASRNLRRSFGESEESLRATYKDLARATSAIPEAVQALFRGIQLYEGADAMQSLVWFDRAIELDSQFALAHLYRGICLAAADDGERGYPSYQRAYELRGRVAQRERLWIESRYANITENRVLAVEILRKLVNLYPDEAIFQRHMGLAYAKIMRPTEALEHDRKAIALNPDSVNNRNELLCDLVQAGRFDEALRQFEQFQREGTASSMLELGAALAWMGKGGYEQARGCFDRMAAGADRDREAKVSRPSLLVLQGRFEEAAEELAGGLSYTTAIDQSKARETFRVRLGLVEWLIDRPEKARLRAGELAQLGTSTPVYLAQLHEGGLLAYLADAADMLTAILGRLREIEAKWRSTYSQGVRAHIEALEKQGLHDPDASASFAEARGLWPDPLVLMSVAQWQSASGQYEEALATLEEFETKKGDVLRWHFSGFVVLGWLERARCLKSLSRIPESLRYYRQVLDHWGQNAGSAAVVRAARGEYLELTHPKG